MSDVNLCAATTMRQGVFVEGIFVLQVTAETNGQIRSIELLDFQPAARRAAMFDCLRVARLSWSLPTTARCTTAELAFEISSEIDLEDDERALWDGERGDWVFRAPRGQLSEFEVTTRGLVSEIEARQLVQAIFQAPLELCFADAAYAALAQESPFNLDRALVIQKVSGRPAEVLSAPAASLEQCVEELDWPSVQDALGIGRMRYILRPRQLLLPSLVAAMERL